MAKGKKETETPTAKSGAGEATSSSSSPKSASHKDELKAVTLKTAVERANAALEKHWDEIYRTFSEAYAEHTKENPHAEAGKMKFPVRLVIRLRPRAGDIGVQAKVTHGITRSATGPEATASIVPELGFETGKKEGGR